MALHKKRRLQLHPKNGGSTMKKARSSLLSDCAMKVPVVVLNKLNLEFEHQSSKQKVKEPVNRLRSDQDRQDDKPSDEPDHSKLSPSPPALNELLASNISNSSDHQQQGALEIRGCTLPAKEQMKVPVVRLSRLNIQAKAQEEESTNESDHKKHRAQDDKPSDEPAHIKLSPSPPALNELLASNISNSSDHQQQGALEIRGCTLPAKEQMKVPVVRLSRLNIQAKAQEEESTNESDHKKHRAQVAGPGNSKAHDEMALSPVAQSPRLRHRTGFTKTYDQQDCYQKTVCRKQLRVQLVRMNIESKNQLERPATDEGDNDHVQPPDSSVLNVQHENEGEQSPDDSDSDQLNEKDLENLCPYEIQRLKTIKQNEKFLKSIKLLEVASTLCQLHKRKIVRREKPQIETVMRRSDRLQGIRALEQMIEKTRLHTIPEKFDIPPSSVNMFPKNNVDHGAWITFQDTWKSISKFAKPSRNECRDLSSYLNNLKSLTTEKRATAYAYVLSGNACCIAIHPSNTHTLVAAGDRLGVIGLWDTKRQSAGVYQFLLHSRTCSLAFSPSNAAHLLSAGREGTVRCGDVSRSVFDEIYHGEERLSSFDFLSADGSVLIVSHFDSTLSVIDRRTPLNTHDVRGFLHLNYVRTVNVHPLERNLCVVAGDGSALIYDVRKLSTSGTMPVMSLLGHAKGVSTASFSPCTGNHIVTGGTDRVVRIFRFKDMENPYPVKSIGFIGSTTAGLIPTFWDPKQENCFGQGLKSSHYLNMFNVKGEVVHQVIRPPTFPQNCVYAFHPTRDLMVSGSIRGTVCVWRNKLDAHEEN
ncbi:WD repeat-containing protein 76 isoform 1-T3 [Anomaloglossus baeobatrachus]|uniref:WD repeat-containing protein 76 n=1 Tax=Anomaloglossus baeobatrachus TaxID=238106 RepID=UPI003F507827